MLRRDGVTVSIVGDTFLSLQNVLGKRMCLPTELSVGAAPHVQKN